MSDDPFAQLGLPRAFELDDQLLTTRHRELSKALHPDRHASATSAQRRMAMSRAIEVNEAFRILRDPVRRAQALLQLEGALSAEGDERDAKPDQEFLLEILDRREALDEAKAARDRSRLDAILTGAKSQVDADTGHLAQVIASALSAEGETRSRKMRDAVPLLGRLRYSVRFRDEASAALDEASEAAET